MTDTSSDLTERRAIFVYEAARLQAVAMDAPIVPEPWEEREAPFRDQFLDVIDMMCGPDRKSSPEELMVRRREADDQPAPIRRHDLPLGTRRDGTTGESGNPVAEAPRPTHSDPLAGQEPQRGNP